MVKQPIDHNAMLKGFFNQNIYLSHESFYNLTVVITDGHVIF